MVLADLGRKITASLKLLNNAPVINEEVSLTYVLEFLFCRWTDDTVHLLPEEPITNTSNSISDLYFAIEFLSEFLCRLRSAI